jgi:hypothetical protein
MANAGHAGGQARPAYQPQLVATALPGSLKPLIDGTLHLRNVRNETARHSLPLLGF